MNDGTANLTDDEVAASAPPLPTRQCVACGAPLDPDDHFCVACGTPQPIPTAEANTPPAQTQRHIECQNCGAQITADEDQKSFVCPFCDSTYVVEREATTHRQPPEFVIGFVVTPDQAIEKFREWLRAGNWFRPGDLKLAQIEDKLRGVYLPFWSFSMLAESNWAATIGENWQRTEHYTAQENGKTVQRTRTVTETEWWPLDGQHHEYYSGYLVSGSRGLSQDRCERIKPFNLPALKRYQPYFLAGWLAEEYTIDRDEALVRCKSEFQRQEEESIRAFMPGDSVRDLRLTTTFSHINSDLILLPVYLLSYRYQEKAFQFLVNGQTGKVAGDKPLSHRRIGAVAGVAILLLVILLYFLFR